MPRASAYALPPHGRVRGEGGGGDPKDGVVGVGGWPPSTAAMLGGCWGVWGLGVGRGGGCGGGESAGSLRWRVGRVGGATGGTRAAGVGGTHRRAAAAAASAAGAAAAGAATPPSRQRPRARGEGRGALPCRAVTRRAVPCRAVRCRAVPCRAVPWPLGPARAATASSRPRSGTSAWGWGRGKGVVGGGHAAPPSVTDTPPPNHAPAVTPRGAPGQPLPFSGRHRRRGWPGGDRPPPLAASDGSDLGRVAPQPRPPL